MKKKAKRNELYSYLEKKRALFEEYLFITERMKETLKYDGAGAVDLFAITATDTSSGHIFDIDMGGIHTGDVFNVDMNAAVGAEFLYLDAGAATRTVNLFEIKKSKIIFFYILDSFLDHSVCRSPADHECLIILISDQFWFNNLPLQ